MNTSLFLTFVILNIFNVVIQTVKSIVTIKSGKIAAALVNALAYGYYTIVIVYTVCELSLGLKVVVVALCNLIGVYFVKYFEEKSRKDKLWKVEMTVSSQVAKRMSDEFVNLEIPHNYLIDSSGEYAIFNTYCATQKQSTFVKMVGEQFHAKYFVSESKNL